MAALHVENGKLPLLRTFRRPSVVRDCDKRKCHDRSTCRLNGCLMIKSTQRVTIQFLAAGLREHIAVIGIPRPARSSKEVDTPPGRMTLQIVIIAGRDSERADVLWRHRAKVVAEVQPIDNGCGDRCAGLSQRRLSANPDQRSTSAVVSREIRAGGLATSTIARIVAPSVTGRLQTGSRSGLQIGDRPTGLAIGNHGVFGSLPRKIC